MNYYIQIIDTLFDTYTTITELASANSIVLRYSGNDSKDELSIVGSSLKFNMEVPVTNNVDGAFLHLFTGDETRYKVVIKRETDDFQIWEGFILPDSYSEPYKGGNFFVDFEATDGLGRLKGKYLQDTFYQFENSVTDIIANCLQLTGLQMPIYLSLGIDNTTEKSWHNIYLDGLHFVKSNKKQDAYKILQSICQDTVSCVFQDLGKWYVTGLNKRNLATYTVKHYTYLGAYVEDVVITRRLKEIVKAYNSPNITMVAPYNIITVDHDRNEVKLPDNISAESNDGWAVVTGVVGEVYASDWVGNGGFYVLSKHSEYNNIIKSIAYQGSPVYYSTDYPFDSSRFVNLNNKLYLKAGQKITFKLELDLTHEFGLTTGAISSIRSAGYWTDPFKYELLLNSTVILTNTNKQLKFDENKKAAIEYDYIPSVSGVLDIKLYQAEGSFDNHKIEYFTLTKVEINDVDFLDTYTTSLTISDNYSIDKDITLTYADDASGFSNAFLLAKLRDPSGSYDSITVPILYGSSYLGTYYSVVQLNGANLIKDNINTTYYGATLLENLEVIYNYQGGEQMVVITNVPYTSGDFTVRVYNTNNYTGSRNNWETWTDAVYSIEAIRYADAVANVYRRMFTIPHPKVDLDVRFPVSFNDILVWNYISQSNYFLTNLSWNLDSGFSTVTMCKAVYQNDDTITEGDNIPPIVNAGLDIYISSLATSTTLTSTAYDPDGFIVSYLWEKLTGDTGDVIAIPIDQNTLLTGLSGNEYEYKVTVTDNDGATAFDTVKVIRTIDYTLDVTLTDSASDPVGTDIDYEVYSVELSPSILPSSIVKITGTYDMYAHSKSNYNYALCKVQIVKNATMILDAQVEGVSETEAGIFEFLYQDGDVITVTIYAEARIDDPTFSTEPNPEATATIVFDGFEVIVGSFDVTNLPITKTLIYIH